MGIFETILDIIIFPFKKFPKASIAILIAVLAIGPAGVHTMLAHLFHNVNVVVGGNKGIHLPGIPKKKP